MPVDASFRVASDVGGTFTDSIAYDLATRRITVSKVSTTPANRAMGTAQGCARRWHFRARLAPTWPMSATA